MNDLETRLTALLAQRADEADVSPDPTFLSEGPDTVVVPIVAGHQRRRRWAPAVAVAATLVVLAGVVVVATREAGESDIPAARPPIDDVVYPTIDVELGWVRDEIEPTTDIEPFAAALVARRVPDGLVDGIHVLAFAQPPTGFVTPAETLELFGEEATVIPPPDDAPDGPTSVVLAGDPTLVLVGLDPVEFLRAAGPDALRAAYVTEPDPGRSAVTIVVGDLPTGYELVIAPFEAPSSVASPMIYSPSTVVADGPPSRPSALVSTVDPRPDLASRGEVRLEEFEGRSYWISDGESKVVWEDRPGIFVVVDDTDVDRARGFADRIRLVDHATWEEAHSRLAPSRAP